MKISDEAVEAAAKKYDEIAYGADWDLLNESQRQSRREEATKILEAAEPYMTNTQDDTQDTQGEK